MKSNILICSDVVRRSYPISWDVKSDSKVFLMLMAEDSADIQIKCPVHLANLSQPVANMQQAHYFMQNFDIIISNHQCGHIFLDLSSKEIKLLISLLSSFYGYTVEEERS